MDFEIRFKKVDQRKIRRRLAVGDRAGFHDQPAVHAMRMGKLVEQPRLSQTRLSNYRNNLTMRAACSLQGRPKLLDCFIASDKMSEAARGCRLQARAHHPRSRKFVRLD